ncbi:MAG: 16S rRNA (cytosine(1402)-N(4))-methyltransferase [Cyanobacteria bacterium M5B4]|nr:MAG: 16S rRNA (cytosine(1402)-N(4))-methyltransferase [Cyanobacteria bacterium M5B4]
MYHIPVLPQEVIEGLNLVESGRYLDTTVGGGGHSALILSHPGTTLTAIDRDGVAIQTAQERLREYNDRVTFWHGNFGDFVPSISFNGIVADLGVSSGQLDTADRGFSFRHEAPLDMRMDQSQALTAADIVNHYDETAIAHILYTLGEERFSRRIAKGIVQSRPIETTTQLAQIVTRSVPGVYRHGRIHCATRTFQALRLAVNQELESLQKWLDVVPEWLAPGGRLVVISFHSLEDRIVKNAFKQDERLIVINKKPIVPTAEESARNPRARSAKLRIAEKIP